MWIEVKGVACMFNSMAFMFSTWNQSRHMQGGHVVNNTHYCIHKTTTAYTCKKCKWEEQQANNSQDRDMGKKEGKRGPSVVLAT
jgi:hypothetical protein